MSTRSRWRFTLPLQGFDTGRLGDSATAEPSIARKWEVATGSGAAPETYLCIAASA